MLSHKDSSLMYLWVYEHRFEVLNGLNVEDFLCLIKAVESKVESRPIPEEGAMLLQALRVKYCYN